MDPNEAMTKAAIVPYAVAGAVLIFALPLIGFIRWLAHRETMRLYEREGEVGPFLEAQERWRTRRGQLFGVVMAWLGGLLVLFCFFGGGRFSELMLLFGGLLLLAGIAFSNAYARWGRMDQDRLHPPTPEQLQERERHRLRRGHHLGLIIFFAGLLLFAVGLVCLIMPGEYEFRDALRRYALQITVVGWFAVPVSLWLMLTGSILMIGYGAAGRRWEDRVNPPTPEQLDERARRRFMWGRLSGLPIIAIGIITLAVVISNQAGKFVDHSFNLGDGLQDLGWLGLIAVGIGIFVVFSRSERRRQHRVSPPTPEELAERTWLRFAWGRMIGMLVTGAGVILFLFVLTLELDKMALSQKGFDLGDVAILVVILVFAALTAMLFMDYSRGLRRHREEQERRRALEKPQS